MLARPKKAMFAQLQPIVWALTFITLGTSVSAEPAQPIPKSVGAAIYLERCASCHGGSGKGDGPAASALKVAPPDLTTITRRAGGTFPAPHIVRVITLGGSVAAAHGNQEMPVWGKIFSVEAGRGGRGAVHSRRAVVQLKRYLESIQQ